MKRTNHIKCFFYTCIMVLNFTFRNLVDSIWEAACNIILKLTALFASTGKEFSESFITLLPEISDMERLLAHATFLVSKPGRVGGLSTGCFSSVTWFGDWLLDFLDMRCDTDFGVISSNGGKEIILCVDIFVGAFTEDVCCSILAINVYKLIVEASGLPDAT